MSPINNTDTIFYWITGNALILLRDEYQGKYKITYQMNNHGMISLQWMSLYFKFKWFMSYSVIMQYAFNHNK